MFESRLLRSIIKSLRKRTHLKKHSINQSRRIKLRIRNRLQKTIPNNQGRA
jgi:hypothetical protein